LKIFANSLCYKELANELPSQWALKVENILASITGMRNGEDKLKLPKNNETRTVEILFP